MAEYVIENDILKVTVSSHGCEIISVVQKATGREYIWCGDPAAWKRHAPVLFPLIGRYKGDESVYEGKIYEMTQHGFARDMEFTLVSKSDTAIYMCLSENAETKAKYPFHFQLVLGYTLEENQIKASYEVINTNETQMYFSIGGHPAFAPPENCKDAQGQSTAVGTELLFEAEGRPARNVRYGLLNEEGLLTEQQYAFPVEDGKITITEDFFDRDAYIVENNQCQRVSLLENGKPYVTVAFDAPVFGVWSAAKKGVPFVCIEPWYGRTDRDTFAGELKDREWGNVLAPKETFKKEYQIIFQ